MCLNDNLPLTDYSLPFGDLKWLLKELENHCLLATMERVKMLFYQRTNKWTKIRIWQMFSENTEPDTVESCAGAESSTSSPHQGYHLTACINPASNKESERTIGEQRQVGRSKEILQRNTLHGQVEFYFPFEEGVVAVGCHVPWFYHCFLDSYVF